MTLLADLKVFPLSEIIRQGKPCLAENLLKLRKNASVVRFGTISRCRHRSNHTACVETYPHFGVWVIHYVKRPCKVHSSVCKWLSFLDSESSGEG